VLQRYDKDKGRLSDCNINKSDPDKEISFKKEIINWFYKTAEGIRN